MNIRLVKSGGDLNTVGDYFDLPAHFRFSDDPFDRDIEVTKKAFQHGGIKQGDGTVLPKDLTISGFYKSNSSMTVNAWTSSLVSFCMYAEPLRLYVLGNSNDGDWFLADCYLQSRPKRPLFYSHIDELDMVFKITNPFWQSETLNTVTNNNVTSGSSIQINNTGDFDTYPVFEFTSLANNGAFSIINESDNYLSMDITDPLFFTGDLISADCSKSTLTRNDLSIMDRLGGGFLKLKKGVNNLKYVGQGPVNIVIKYRNLRG